MREALEYAAAWLALKTLGVLPRPLARAAGAGVARVFYWLRPPLRRAARVNLRLAFPEWTPAQRRRTVRGLLRHLGWMAAEFAHFPKHTRESFERLILLEGFENFAAARAQGRGVLLLTGHCGAWELAPMVHAVIGGPMSYLARPVPNRRVEALVERYRSVFGNTAIDKSRAARAVLGVLREGGSVGVLMDLNTTPDEGVFVPFFGVPACTTTGLARIALRTGAPVLPAFVYWDAEHRKYRARIEPVVELLRTGEEARDLRENTARFTRVIEDFARRHPDQWLWVHKRWKTRPPGEPPLY